MCLLIHHPLNLLHVFRLEQKRKLGTKLKISGYRFLKLRHFAINLANEKPTARYAAIHLHHQLMRLFVGSGLGPFLNFTKCKFEEIELAFQRKYAEVGDFPGLSHVTYRCDRFGEYVDNIRNSSRCSNN